MNTIPYADGQNLISTSEYELQTMVYHLNLIAKKHKMTISSAKVKSMVMWGNHIQSVKIEINDNIIEQVTYFKYLGYRRSEYKSDLEDKLQTYNKINGAIRRHFGKQVNEETKLRIHNITAKTALKFGSEAWVLKFLRHLLGITKLRKEKNQCIREKTGAQNIVKEIIRVPEKVTTTRTEDGHIQTTKTSTTISTKSTKEHKTTEEEMEGPTSS